MSYYTAKVQLIDTVDTPKGPKEKKVTVAKATVDNSTIIDTTKYITIEEHNKIVDEIVNLSKQSFSH